MYGPMMWLGMAGFCPIRLAAEVSLFLSIPVLLFKLYKTGHEGVSVSTQLLHLLVFTTRYLDLSFSFISLYNTLSKAYLLLGTLLTLLLLLHTSPTPTPTALPQRQLLFLIAPCAVLAYFYNYWPAFTQSEYPYFGSVAEYAWAFSMYLAVVAEVPQLCELSEAPAKDPYLVAYVVLVFGFRALYIPHWYLRYQTEGSFDPIAIVTGVAQTVVFVAFGLGMLVKRLRGGAGGVQLKSDALFGTQGALSTDVKSASSVKVYSAV